jgi:phage antirepressor YoqD-like protein
MNELQVFNINGIDCYERNGTVYLRLETVARGLGFTEIAASGNECVRWRTVKKYLAELGIATSCDGDLPEFIPENIFYRLAMKAKNEAAEAFQAKIADDVIPTIRRNGAYMTPDTLDQMISSPEFGIRLLTELKSEQERRKALEEKVKADAPAVRFANAITSCDTNILVRDLAKILKQNGVDTGEKRLYEQLRSDGYLIKEGSDKNMPTQRAMDLGLFFIKESPRISKDGAVIDRVSKVTPKGQKYFLNRYAAARRRDLPARTSGAEN